MSAGYSGTPLARKLGLKAGMKCHVVDPPGDYRSLFDELPAPLELVGDGEDPFDFVHLFVREAGGLTERISGLRARIARDGMIWVSWPKKASGVVTDVNENVVRDAALAAGLVDVKVCAVDETWSGLKLVIRIADRR